jgi:hypothetical protein
MDERTAKAEENKTMAAEIACYMYYSKKTDGKDKTVVPCSLNSCQFLYQFDDKFFCITNTICCCLYFIFTKSSGCFFRYAWTMPIRISTRVDSKVSHNIGPIFQMM